MTTPQLHRFEVIGPSHVIEPASHMVNDLELPWVLASSVFVHDGPASQRLELLCSELPDHDALLLLLGLHDTPVNAHVSPLTDQDWVALSQAGRPAVHAGRFRVRESTHRRLSGGTVDLLIEAGEAFGTGHHGTTAGCLQVFSECLKHTRPRRVLDVGCGSGVLAIAAAKVLRRAVIATDIDPIAVRVTEDNAAINHVPNLIKAATASGLSHPLLHGRRFDLIFANVLAEPLISLASDITNALVPGGRVILSGLLTDQARSVEAAYRARGATLERRLILGEWATLVLRHHSISRPQA